MSSRSILVSLSIAGFFVGVAAGRTSAQVTRDIAIAGLIIAGITFLMTCLMCMAGAGMGVLRMLERAGPHHDHHDRSSRGGGQESSRGGSGSDGNSGIGVRAGNTL